MVITEKKWRDSQLIYGCDITCKCSIATQSQSMAASNCMQGWSNSPLLDNKPTKSEFLFCSATESYGRVLPLPVLHACKQLDYGSLQVTHVCIWQSVQATSSCIAQCVSAWQWWWRCSQYFYEPCIKKYCQWQSKQAVANPRKTTMLISQSLKWVSGIFESAIVTVLVEVSKGVD